MIDEIISVPQKFWTQVTYDYHYNSNEDLMINVEVNTTHDAENITVVYSVRFPKNEKDKNFDKLLITSSFNICKVFAGSRGSVVAKTIMEGLQDHVDLELKCPIKKVMFFKTLWSFGLSHRVQK